MHQYHFTRCKSYNSCSTFPSLPWHFSRLRDVNSRSRILWGPRQSSLSTGSTTGGRWGWWRGFWGWKGNRFHFLVQIQRWQWSPCLDRIVNKWLARIFPTCFVFTTNIFTGDSIATRLCGFAHKTILAALDLHLLRLLGQVAQDGGEGAWHQASTQV